ncbi:MAG: Wzz/FepE/Etk N-terminal domain-containing protein [Mediterraneibacter gnavus]
MNTRTVNDGIDLLDLCKSILRKVHLVILAGILMAFGFAILVTKLFVTPMYTSTTKMYVLSKQDSETAVTSGDLSGGISVDQRLRRGL